MENSVADLTLTCPHCGYSRQIPAAKMPDRPSRVTCPKCRGTFGYRPVGGGDVAKVDAIQTPAAEELQAGVPPQGEAALGQLRGIPDLLRDCWEIYISRIGVLMGLYLLSVLFLLAPLGLFLMIGGALALALPEQQEALFAAGLLTGVLLGSVGLVWGMAALTFAVVDQALGMRAALEKGGRKIWAFAWVFSLTGYVVTGGFLLFVLPGVIFSVWFFLAQIVLVAEDERGMRALLKSKAYMRGRFFDVLLRLVLVWSVSAVLGMVPIFGAILSLLFVPFVLIFSWLIYDDLRPKQAVAPFTCTAGEKTTWLLIGTLGYLVVPLSFILLALGWFGGAISGLSLPWHGFGFIAPLPHPGTALLFPLAG